MSSNSNKENRSQNAMNLDDSKTEEAPLSKKSKHEPTFLETWQHLFERCKIDPSYKELLPVGLEPYLDLCKNPDALKAAQCEFFDRLLGPGCQGEFRKQMKEPLFHLFFMLENFPYILVQETHLHFHAKDIDQFVELIQYIAQHVDMNQQALERLENTCDVEPMLEKFVEICPKLIEKFGKQKINNRFHRGLEHQTIWEMFRDGANKCKNCLVDNGDSKYYEDPADVFLRYITFCVEDQYAKVSYNSKTMEHIQQIQKSDTMPWYAKYDQYSLVWCEAMAVLGNMINQEKTAQYVGLPTTVLEMERLKMNPSELQQRVNNFSQIMLCNAYDSIEFDWIQHPFPYQEKVVLFEFCFLFIFHPYVLFQDTPNYIPWYYLKSECGSWYKAAAVGVEDHVDDQEAVVDVEDDVDDQEHKERLQSTLNKAHDCFGNLGEFPSCYVSLLELYQKEFPKHITEGKHDTDLSADDVTMAITFVETLVQTKIKFYKQEIIRAKKILLGLEHE